MTLKSSANAISVADDCPGMAIMPKTGNVLMALYNAVSLHTIHDWQMLPRKYRLHRICTLSTTLSIDVSPYQN
jgi:hypothetical protein